MNEQADDPEFAAALDGSSSFEVRAPVLARFRRGEIKVLVNCSLFTEGFDVPQIALVAIARPVLSRSFYAQTVGRGTRICDGKHDLLVLDFVPGNCRHSLAQAVDIFASATLLMKKNFSGASCKISLGRNSSSSGISLMVTFTPLGI